MCVYVCPPFFFLPSSLSLLFTLASSPLLLVLLLPSVLPPPPLFLPPSSPPQALSQEEYDHWLEERHAAEIALENRDTLLFESACAIEKNLELLGKDLAKTVNIQLDISRS